MLQKSSPSGKSSGNLPEASGMQLLRGLLTRLLTGLLTELYFTTYAATYEANLRRPTAHWLKLPYLLWPSYGTGLSEPFRKVFRKASRTFRNSGETTASNKLPVSFRKPSGTFRNCSETEKSQTTLPVTLPVSFRRLPELG